MVAALERRDLQVVLELLELHAQGGLAHMAGLGRPYEVLLVRQRDEVR
jgi:hypothetical protein